MSLIPSLKPCYFMRSNNYLVLGIQFLRQRVEQAVLKNLLLIFGIKNFLRDTSFYTRHYYNWIEKVVSFIEQLIYKGSALIIISKLKSYFKLLLISFTNRLLKFFTINYSAKINNEVVCSVEMCYVSVITRN